MFDLFRLPVFINGEVLLGKVRQRPPSRVFNPDIDRYHRHIDAERERDVRARTQVAAMISNEERIREPRIVMSYPFLKSGWRYSSPIPRLILNVPAPRLENMNYSLREPVF